MYTAGYVCLDVVFTPLLWTDSSNGNVAIPHHLGGTWRYVVIACVPFKWRAARKVLNGNILHGNL